MKSLLKQAAREAHAYFHNPINKKISNSSDRGVYYDKSGGVYKTKVHLGCAKLKKGHMHGEC